MERNELFCWVKEVYETKPDYPWKDWNAVLRHSENQKWYAVILEVNTKKLGLSDERMTDVVNIKCDPALVGSLRNRTGYFPAYHMNKENWISILLDGSVSRDEIQKLITLSYELTSTGKNSKLSKRTSD